MADKLLLEDGTSRLLLEDGASILLLESLAQGGDPAPLPHLGLLLAASGAGFDLSPTAAAALSATVTPAGSIALATAYGGQAALSGSLTPAGAFVFGVAYSTGGDASLSGGFGASGAILSNIEFPVSGTVSLATTLTPAGALSFGDPFELDAPLEAALSGSFSAAGTIQTISNLAQGGDPAPLPHLGLLLAAAGGPFTLSGNVSLDGAITPAGAIAQAVEIAGNAQISGSLSPSGQPALEIAVGGQAALSATLAAAGQISAQVEFLISGAVALSASFGAAGALESGSQTGGGGGGLLHRYRLAEAFKSKRERDEAVRKLPKATQAERVVLKKAARKLLKQEPVNYKELEARVSADLAQIGMKPSPNHLDWLLYFLRVESYIDEQIKLQAQAEEDAAAVIAMLLMEN